MKAGKTSPAFFLINSFLLSYIMKCIGNIVFVVILLLGIHNTMVFAQNQEIVILHTNDTHSQIESFTDRSGASVGGFLRREACIREIREAHPHLLLFDAGDHSQGSPYFNIFKGYTEIKLMNAMRYDACALGNHEFDLGIPALAKRLKTAKFPVICSNYKFDNKPLSRVLKSHVIIPHNTKKIGVFALLPDLNALISPTIFCQMTYMDPIMIANQEVKALQKEGCDMIICLSHLGTTDPVVNDILLAEKVEGIDIIIGGHTHLQFETPKIINNTHIYQLANKGRSLGQITINY